MVDDEQQLTERMKGKQTVLMPGNDDKVGFWLTPPDFMRELDDEFHFDFDPCPYPRPDGFDGLTEEWGMRNWVNPPFKGNKMAWVRKAITEWQKGKLVVFMFGLGNRSHIIDLLSKYEDIEFRARSIYRYNPEGKRCQKIYPCIIFILRPRGNDAMGRCPTCGKAPHFFPPK